MRREENRMSMVELPGGGYATDSEALNALDAEARRRGVRKRQWGSGGSESGTVKKRMLLCGTAAKRHFLVLHIFIIILSQIRHKPLV